MAEPAVAEPELLCADVLLDMSAVPYEELPLLRLFSGMIDEVRALT